MRISYLLLQIQKLGMTLQVEDCSDDLSKAKDYHRWYKVCETYSKASRAFVGNQMQRFCQQCSSFHALQEFDEGKHSCRQRLAYHNKKRRKSQLDNFKHNNPLNDNEASGYLLMTLLKILSNMHPNRSNHEDDHDMLSHLLHNLASQSSLHGKKSISRRPKESHNFTQISTFTHIFQVRLMMSVHELIELVEQALSLSSDLPQYDIGAEKRLMQVLLKVVGML